jgi:hypothetical protein
MTEQEIWKDINGYEGLYKLSNFGRIYSVRNKLIMTLELLVNGYYRVCFNSSGKRDRFRVHILVATHFIDNPNGKTQVNHKDGNKKNNHYKNLEWCTPSENLQHAFSLGLKDTKGEKHPLSALTEREVKEIRLKKENGASNFDLAKEYETTTYNIYNIVVKRSWKHI